MKKALTQLIRDKTSCEKPLVNEKTAEIKIKNMRKFEPSKHV